MQIYNLKKVNIEDKERDYDRKPVIAEKSGSIHEHYLLRRIHRLAARSERPAKIVMNFRN